jgi:hypothetical protein
VVLGEIIKKESTAKGLNKFLGSSLHLQAQSGFSSVKLFLVRGDFYVEI